MAKTGLGNFDYTMQGYWRGAAHKFSITGNHSGSAFTAAVAPTFMTGAASPFALSFAPFIAVEGVTCVSARYYNGTDSAPIWEASYDEATPPPSTLQGTATAFAEAAGEPAPLESVVLLEANVGQSATNKPIFTRKYLRGAPQAAMAGSATGAVWDFSNTVATAAAKSMGDGSWYSNRVYCSPSGRQALGSPWVAAAFVANHQVPRGKKRKASSAGTTTLARSILNAIDSGVAVGGIASLVEAYL